jgi:hypothetical protein
MDFSVIGSRVNPTWLCLECRNPDSDHVLCSVPSTDKAQTQKLQRVADKKKNQNSKEDKGRKALPRAPLSEF